MTDLAREGGGVWRGQGGGGEGHMAGRGPLHLGGDQSRQKGEGPVPGIIVGASPS